jgi:DNA replication protein DnaC
MDNLPGLRIITGIQPDHYQSLLENFDQRYDESFYQELTKVAQDIIEDKLDKRFVFLTGPPGSGKTHFLVGLFRSKVMQDKGVMGAEHSIYLPFSNMITEIISGLVDTHSTRVGLARYLTAKCLFIDDISRGERVIDPDKIEGQCFRDILLDRFENKRMLICTSNYTKQELLRMTKSVFGDYVASRVESSSVFLQFKSKDWRKEAANEPATK